MARNYRFNSKEIADLKQLRSQEGSESVQKEMQLDPRDELNRTPLMLAAIVNKASCWSLYAEVAEHLLRHSADACAVDSRGNTAAHFAAQSGNIFILALLPFCCKFKQNNCGNTPLMEAIRTAKLACAKHLLHQARLRDARHLLQLENKDQMSALKMTECEKSDVLRQIIKSEIEGLSIEKQQIASDMHAMADAGNFAGLVDKVNIVNCDWPDSQGSTVLQKLVHLTASADEADRLRCIASLLTVRADLTPLVEEFWQHLSGKSRASVSLQLLQLPELRHRQLQRSSSAPGQPTKVDFKLPRDANLFLDAVSQATREQRKAELTRTLNRLVSAQPYSCAMQELTLSVRSKQPDEPETAAVAMTPTASAEPGGSADASTGSCDGSDVAVKATVTRTVQSRSVFAAIGRSSEGIVGGRQLDAADSLPTTSPTVGRELAAFKQPGVCAPAKSDYYKVKSTQGVCLIINVERFTGSQLTTRQGSEKDVVAVRALFKRLGFRIVTVEDPTAEEIDSCLTWMSKSDHKAYSCFVCCLMSHGRKGKIFGADGRERKIRDLVDKFTPQNCKTLTHKPKIFIVQACRTKSDASVGSPMATDSCQPQQEPADLFCPEQSDFLTIFATPDRYPAYRSPESGSPFVQTACKLIGKLYDRDCLCSIILKVNEELKVSNIVGDDGEKLEIVAETKSTLSRKIMLDPQWYAKLKD